MRMHGKTKHIYAEAERDIHKKLDDFLARFKAEDERRKKLVDAGKMPKAEYDSWRRGQVFRGKRWQALRDEIVDQIYGSNKTAARIMNDERRSVFIQNANRTAYELEKKTHGAVSFELYDSATVTRLMKKDRKLLPYAEIKKMKDGKYNRKKVNNALTQSIIQGESMDKLAGRIAEAVSSKNASLMYSFARTMMTGAQNAGRLEAMREARDMGIKLKKRWLATLDSHTRDTHRDLDGVSVDVDKPFVIDGKEIMFPGDPNADADLVVNCRCTLIYDYEDYPANIQRRDNETGEVIEWMTYREWEASKKGDAGATDQLEITIPKFEPAKTRAEAEEYAGRFADNVLYRGLSADNCNTINRCLNELTAKYPIKKLESIEQKQLSAVMSASWKTLNIDGKKLGAVLNTASEDFKKSQEYAIRQIEDIKARFAKKAKMPFSAQITIDKLSEKLKFTRYGVHESYEDHVKCTVAHEYGHILSDQYFGMINEDRANPNYKTNWSLANRSRKWNETFLQARKTGDIYGISEYSSRNSREFFAECFAAREMGEKLPDYIESLMKETLEDGIM